MNDWFEWNGVRCTQYGIYVSELPPPTIPSERVTYTNVPGRPGSLTTLEGEDVYEDVVLTAQCFLSDPTKIPAIARWLKGSGKVAFAHRQGAFTMPASPTRSVLKRYCAGIPTGVLPSISAANHSGIRLMLIP